MAKTHGDYEQLLHDWIDAFIPNASLPRSNDRRTRAAQHFAIARLACHHSDVLYKEKRAALFVEFNGQMPVRPGNHLIHDDIHVTLTALVTTPRRLSEAAVLTVLTELCGGDTSKAAQLLDACKTSDTTQQRLASTLKR